MAPPPEGLNWLSEVFVRFYPADAPRPHIYPMPDGGVQFEWSLGRQEISLEIDLRARRAVWHRLDLSAWEEDERWMDLARPDGWEWVAGELRRLNGGG